MLAPDGLRDVRGGHLQRHGGLWLRSGHMQDRHVHPLQSMMACDTLKLMTYCLSHEAPEALPMWKPLCDHAHYTVPSCDAVCSGGLRAGLGLLAVAYLLL